MNKDYVVTCNIYEFDRHELTGVISAEAIVGVHGEGVPLSMLTEVERQIIQKFGSDTVVLFESIVPKDEDASDE